MCTKCTDHERRRLVPLSAATHAMKYPFHAVKKWRCMFRREKVDVLVFFGRSGPRPPKQAMPVAIIACLEKKYYIRVLVSFAGSGK